METTSILMVEPNTCHLDDVKLKNIEVESTSVTIFEEEVIRKLEVLMDIYHHFGGERE